MQAGQNNYMRGEYPLWGNYVSVLGGNGDGTFQSAAQYTVGYGPCSLVATDFNQDGTNEIVSSVNTVAILWGTSTDTDGVASCHVVSVRIGNIAKAF